MVYVAALLFCAVTYGGCGGSDNLATENTNSGGDTSQTVSGDTTGRGDIGDDWEIIDDEPKAPADGGWEVLDDVGYFETLVNTWKITNITMEAYGKLYGQESIVSSGMIGRTFKINVSNVKEAGGSGSVMEEYEGTVNVGYYDRFCMFRVNDNIADVELIPDNATFQSVHRGTNLAFETKPDANRSTCSIDVDEYAAGPDKITIYYEQYNREEWPYACTIVTELEAVY